MKPGTTSKLAISIVLLCSAFGVHADGRDWYTMAATDVPLAVAPMVSDMDLPLLPNTEAFQFNTQDEFYEKRRYSESFRIKGVEISNGVYFGEARVAGRKGPGIVVERGELSWGFNHRGAEVLFRF